MIDRGATAKAAADLHLGQVHQLNPSPAEQARTQHRYAYLPFGAGPRACMGATLAMTEAVALLAVMLRRTRFSASPDYRPRPIVRVTLRPQGGIPMRTEPRQRPLTGPAPHR